MRISSTLFQTSSLFMKGSYSDIKRTPVQRENGTRQDRNNVSPQGRAMSMVQQLNDQKKAIGERRRDLIGRTLESGGDMKTIEAQLDNYDQRLEELDQQISQLTTDLAKQMADKLEKKEEKQSKADENKTEEQAETERLTNLAVATDKLDHAESICALKGEVEAAADVKEAEIGLSDVEADTYESKDILARGMAKAQRTAKVEDLPDERAEPVANPLTSTGPGAGLEKIIARIRKDMSEAGTEVSELRRLADSMDMDAAALLREAAEQAEDPREADAPKNDATQAEDFCAPAQTPKAAPAADREPDPADPPQAR